MKNIDDKLAERWDKRAKAVQSYFKFKYELREQIIPEIKSGVYETAINLNQFFVQNNYAFPITICALRLLGL